MLLNRINLNHLRIFDCVYRTMSMTLAAQELHLTQSGVSQHIRSLEEMLDIRLFDRVQQKLIPTAQATALFKKCTEGLSLFERGLFEAQDHKKGISGKVSIGIPTEFGNNVIIPKLVKLGKKNPGLRFHITLGIATEMNTKLLSGELDFAFVDALAMDKRIKLERVYDEILDLCINPKILKTLGSLRQNRNFFESLDYVEYQRNEPILKMWFSHHFRTKNPTLNIRATVMDVQSVARLILGGLGAGILPHHLVLKLKEEGHKLYCFKGCGNPLKNSISIAYLRDRTHSNSALALLQWLKTAI